MQKFATANFQDRLVMSCCGARNFLLALAHKISTAATPYASLDLPPAALGNVPTSIPLRIYVKAQKSSTFNIKFSRLRPVMSCCGARNFCSLSLTKFRPLPLLMPRLICHRQRSATSPLRYLSVYMLKLKKAQHSILNFLGSAPLCPVAVPEIFCSLSLTKFRPLPLLMPRLICHRQRSATSPLR